jgi:carboxypeptidase C (cathepsin A)
MDAGNDLGFVNFLPSYAATAWYHKKLPADLQKLTVQQVTTQAEKWAETDYASALMRGARLTDAQRHATAEQLARFTGTSTTFAEENDLRITLGRFNQELLRDQHQTSGRLDSRFTTYATDQGAERGQFDPSEASIRNSFSPVMSEYARRELGYRNEDVYYILGGGIGRWRYPQNNGYANVVPSLERAFAKNPEMKLYVAEGYYDMATPYYAVEYTLAHMSVDPRVRGGIVTERFEAGHMVYIDSPSMTKMREGLRRFIDSALPQAQRAER